MQPSLLPFLNYALPCAERVGQLKRAQLLEVFSIVDQSKIHIIHFNQMLNISRPMNPKIYKEKCRELMGMSDDASYATVDAPTPLRL